MIPKSSLPDFRGIGYLDLALPSSDSKATDGKPSAALKSTLPMIPPFRKAILPKSTLSMPKISFDKIHCLPKILYEDIRMQSELGSQGLFVSDDGSYAYSHESSYPDVCFIIEDELPCAVNMDRGGVATRSMSST